MKISNNITNITSFKSGLTKDILLKEKSANIAQQQYLFEEFGIETLFLNNASAALANKMCLDIFENLACKYNMNLTVPPAIFLYEKEQLINENLSENFCIQDTKEVLKNEYPFVGRTIFFRNFSNLEQINETTETLNKKGINSSSHFLAPFIHEWLHSFQLDYIFRKFGYDGDCEYLKEIYSNNHSKISSMKLLKQLETKFLSPKENEIVLEQLGYYSIQPINQYLEIFSETLTQFICSSIKNGILVKNPFEQIKNTPPDFQKIFKKVCLLK